LTAYLRLYLKLETNYMSIKISIITINFNDKTGLEKTIKSIINQTWKGFESIVIDGGSNDGSKEIIEKYKNKISYSVSEPDTGIYNAMNKGITVAKGDFILFLNSGDCLHNPNVIDQVIKVLDSKISIYYGNLCITKNGVKNYLLTPPDTLDFLYFINNSLPHPASFIKKELFKKYFFYNENLKIISDWEFFVFCICKMNESYKHLNFEISDFDDAGVSSKIENQYLIKKEEKLVLENHFPLFIDQIEIMQSIKPKRFYQLYHISKHRIRWKIIKALLNCLIIFDSKKIKSTNNTLKKY
jgi:glycosyltransferase involved in cell wall biosynthesis